MCENKYLVERTHFKTNKLYPGIGAVATRQGLLFEGTRGAITLRHFGPNSRGISEDELKRRQQLLGY